MLNDGIFIGDLDPAAVLAALYNASQPLGLGWLHYESEPMTVDEARKVLADAPDEPYGAHQGQPYFDYLRGRVMKVWIGGESLNPRLYDRDNGPGAAQRAIDALRTSIAREVA